MNFKLLFLLLWLLAFLLPGSDVRTYIQLLSDASTIVLDQPMNHHAASNSVFLVSAAFPTPRSCYTPPVFPFYFGKARGPKPSRFNRGKRVVRIYKWMNVFYAQMISHIECSRPTKTSNPPTRVVGLAYPAPPTAGRYLLDDAPAQILTNLAIDLAGLWNAYKLIFGWIAFTLLISAFTFIRFISFHSTTVHLSDFADPAVDDIHSSDDSGAVSGVSLLPSLPFDSEASIIDMYHSLDYPPFTPDDIPFGLTNRANPTSQDTTMSIATNNELFPRTYSSSVCTDVAFALPAWIDTKTGVEGPTEMNGTSVEGKILEPAVSNSSIGSVFKFYGGGSRAITPSSSSLSIPCSSEELLARYPASGQVHSPRTGRWLEDFITHLRSMERQGNHFGRVYDGWTGNTVLESQESESGPASSYREDSTDQSGYTTPYPQSTVSPHMSSQPSFVSELSYTTSQGSLYELLGGLVGPAAQHTRGDRKQVGGQVKHKAEGKIVVRLPRPCPADIPLPPSPYVELQAAMARKGAAVEEDVPVRAADTRPLDVCLPGLTIDRMDVFSVDTSGLIIGE